MYGKLAEHLAHALLSLTYIHKINLVGNSALASIPFRRGERVSGCKILRSIHPYIHTSCMGNCANCCAYPYSLDVGNFGVTNFVITYALTKYSVKIVYTF